MTSSSASRHLSRAGLAQYLASRAPAVIVVDGDPVCRIVIDVPRRRMTLRTPRRSDVLPDLSEFAHVDARIVAADGAVWAELGVDYHDHGHEAYLFIGDVADMIQQSGAAFDVAVRAAVVTFDDLLARTSGLSAEQQTGLYGELLFLGSCMRTLSPTTAVDAWKGFAPNEHDFVLPGACFEVKTTRQERRVHRIGNLHQLTALPDTRLWLVSVQLTAATATTGRSLARLVDDVRAAAGPARTVLDALLDQAGWRDRDRARYAEPFTLRTVPAAYDVDGDFPVLDRAVVDRGCVRPQLILDATYTIDVTSLEPGAPPSPADRFVKGDE